MRDSLAQSGLISPVLFNLYDNNMPSISHHVELALYASDPNSLSHVPQAEATRQQPGIVTQRPSTVVERMENRHKCLKEQRDDIRVYRTSFLSPPISNTLRGTNAMSLHYSFT